MTAPHFIETPFAAMSCAFIVNTDRKMTPIGFDVTPLAI